MDRSRPHYKNLFDNLNRPMYFTTTVGKFIEVNDAYVTLFGYSREELKNMTVQDLYVNPIQRNKIIKKIENQHNINEEILIFKNKKGKVLFCENSAVIVKNDSGQIMGFQGILIDLTEQIQIKQRLELLKRAVRQSVNIIIITDNEGNIEFVNSQFTKTTGYEEEEVINKNPRILKSGRTNPSVYQNLWDKILNGKVWKGRFNNKTKDGKYYWARSTITPIFNKDGTEITHFIDVQEDITKEMEYKNKLKKTRQKNFQLQQKLVHHEKLQEIGQLAGGIAHDFNNLLTIIVNNLEIIKLTSDNETILDIIDDITNATDRASILIKRLLNYSRKSTYDMEIINIKVIIDNVTSMLEQTLSSDHDLEVINNAEKMAVKVDPSALENVLINLVINASEALPNGGNIKISTENITINNSSKLHHKLQHGDYIVIHVIDNGEGMMEDIIKLIFNPFYTTKRNGVGLGLASSYGTILSHDGIISVKSQINEGSKFSVYLPLSKFDTEKVLIESDVNFDKKNIMVIDDEHLILQSLDTILSDYDHIISAHADPVEAIDYYRKNNPKIDFVILDLNMPEMNGYEVLKKLKKIDPNVRVIVYSGNLANNDPIMYDPAVIATIHKPFDKDDLLEAINRKYY